MSKIQIFHLSDHALLLSWPQLMDAAQHQQIMQVDRLLNNTPFPGFTETVPAYASLTVFYDALYIRKQTGGPAHTWVRAQLEQLLTSLQPEQHPSTDKPVIRIPVYYAGVDLESLAAARQLSVDAVIDVHAAPVYQVFMVGFLPGFAYMGTVDERIATPRKQQPVPTRPGAVGIAGQQTGIYPLHSPGGWHIVGHTPWKIFDASRIPASLLSPGDRVQFYPISRDEFDHS